MSELSPDARDLIAQARNQRRELGPSSEQRARLRERLTPLWAADAPKPPARWGLRWKVATAVVIAGLSAWGATAWRPEPEPTLQASSRLPPANVVQAGPLLAAAEVSGAELALGSDPQLIAATSAPRANDRSGSVAHPLKLVSARRSERKPVNESAGPGAVAVAPGVQRDAQAGSGHDASERSEAAPSALQVPPARRPSAARYRSSERQLNEPAPQPARADRLPLRADEDRTPERSVETAHDPAPPSIDGELELLGAAQAALQKQRPSRALTLLQEHSFRFPTGSLVEERMAMQALALCALQRRHAAETVLSNLEARGSKSQLLPRVRSQCGL